ncbi:hypothetical protein B1729_07290 [Microbacterium sp. B35-04]|uniref:hypothetical protein n=1 Tax=unclassified Microbacterium TaxID=2609290 RepID=UPI0013D0DB11|nr:MULTISPECIES: hypothetical protein [unclassified Microbacterium]KAF2413937.1 hypothetical protein B1729_07290 [Microbacterium sp. B35-04]KAF2420059.1 hypothetical protein B2K11_02680 [Microbacterium sp. B35-30]
MTRTDQLSHSRPRREGSYGTRVAYRAPDAAGDEELRRGLRILLLVTSLAVLSVGIPAFLIADVSDLPRSDAWVVTLVLLVWAGIRLSLLWVRGTPRLFDFFFWLFVYIFMGIAPTAQILSGLTSTTTPGVDTGLDMPTTGVVVLGVFCYEVGRLLFMLREGRRRTAGRPLVVRSVSSWRTVALFVISLALSGYVLWRLGAIALLGSRDAAAAARAAAWPDPAVRSLVFASGIYPMLVAVGAMAQLRRTASSAQSRRLALVGALTGAAILLLIVNPITSARYSFGTVVFALAVYAGAVRTRRRARITMLAAIAGFLLVFPIADAFRRVGAATGTRSGFFDEYLSNPDYDAFWQVANALSYWVDGLVAPMNQFAGSALFWVPRALWPNKPTDTGILLAEYRGYTFDNLSAPTWAEALVNGGIIAVVVGFLLLGLVLRVMDSRIVPALRVGGVWAIVGAILPVFMTILLRGSLLQATGALFLTVLCILVVVGSRGPAEAGPDPGPPPQPTPDAAVTGSPPASIRSAPEPP